MTKDNNNKPLESFFDTSSQYHSVTHVVAEEIGWVVDSSPDIADLFGGEEILEQTVDNILSLDAKFEYRDGLLFQTGDTPFETGEIFTELHINDYRENGRPSLATQAIEFAEEIKLDKESAEYKALVLVAMRAEIAGRVAPDYHSGFHYFDVGSFSGIAVRKNNELADSGVEGAIKLTPQQQALTVIAAIAHDLDHPGGKNPKDDPLYYERSSFEKVKPFLKAAGLDDKSIETINILFTTTSPDGPHAIIKEVARAHRENDTVDWNEVDPDNKFPQLRILEDDPGLVQMAAILSDADLYASAGASLEANIKMSELFTKELQDAGIDEDLCGDQKRLGFFDWVVGKLGFASIAGRHIANEVYMAMRAETEEKLGVAELN